MSTFRTKLVIKRWKESFLHQAMKQMQDYQKLNVPPNSYQYKNICNRCGIDVNGCRPYPCQEGKFCGIPRHPATFIPSVFQNPLTGAPMPLPWKVT